MNVKPMRNIFISEKNPKSLVQLHGAACSSTLQYTGNLYVLNCNLTFGLHFHEVMSAWINIDVRRCGPWMSGRAWLWSNRYIGLRRHLSHDCRIRVESGRLRTRRYFGSPKCNFEMCSLTSSHDSFFSLQILYQYFVIYCQFIILKLILQITSRHQQTIYYVLSEELHCCMLRTFWALRLKSIIKSWVDGVW